MMTRGAALRVSLLVAMGIVPAACGDDDDTANTPNGGSAGQGGEQAGGEAGAATAGKSTQAGSDSVGGGGRGGYVLGTCTNPELDPASGLVKCDEGFSHRATATQCQVLADGAGGGAGGGASAEGAAGAPDFSCVTDSDCFTGGLCVCGSEPSRRGGRCVVAYCKTDQDCGQGLCATYMDACGTIGLTCQSSRDACISNDDCETGTCYYDPRSGDLPASLHRYCDQSTCGRPFLVHEQARVAPVTRSAAWRANERLKPRLDHLAEAERASLAAHWTKLGQLEHASIAAFARFSLQLLALGAPPDLVEGCTQALADETAHTKLCFELASAYAGRAVGPGPVDIDGSLAASSLTDIVDLVIAEGCFGETGAALEAFEAAESASDPVIAAAYAQIATDEQRHAELAFRFVPWALERGGDEVAERIHRALAAPPVANVAARGVALPCLQALLAHAGHVAMNQNERVREA